MSKIATLKAISNELLLYINKVAGKPNPAVQTKKTSVSNKSKKPTLILLTNFCTIAWIISTLLSTNISGLFGANSTCIINDYTIYYLRSYLITIIIAIIGATPILKNIIEKLKTKAVMNKIINILEPIAMVIIILIVTAYLVDNSYNPFLYFRF